MTHCERIQHLEDCQSETFVRNLPGLLTPQKNGFASISDSPELGTGILEQIHRLLHLLMFLGMLVSNGIQWT